MSPAPALVARPLELAGEPGRAFGAPAGTSGPGSVVAGLAGPLVLEPRVFADERGFFLESYSREVWRQAGVPVDFVQDNHSRSRVGVLRGLHYQSTPGQAKLLRVGTGRIFDVAVDVRPGSPTFGRWGGLELDAVSHRQLYIPIGFAHGFCVLSDVADVLYNVSSLYDPATEKSLAWNDPQVGIEWPVQDPIVSARDREAESFASLRARLGAS